MQLDDFYPFEPLSHSKKIPKGKLLISQLPDAPSNRIDDQNN